MRLSPVCIPGSNRIYEPNSTVQTGDLDIGYPLNSFLANEKHYKSDHAVTTYTVSKKYGFDFYADFIYQDLDHDNFVTPGEKRLSPINVSVDGTTGQRKNFGLTGEDGFMLVEIPETKEMINFALETNYLSIDSQMEIAVKVFSSSCQVPLNITSLSQSISVGLNRMQFISFVQNIQPTLTGYLGFEWFLDNGINNKIFSQSLQNPVANNLSDDFTENEQSEEIWGQYSRSGDMDYRSSISTLPGNIRFFDYTGSGFGAGIPFYRDIDNSFSVSEGDERLIDIDLNTGSTGTSYGIGSYVSLNDADVGFYLQDIPSQFRFADKNPLFPEFSHNGGYEIYEPVYKKNALSVELGYVEVGDFRITPVTYGTLTYSQGTFVAPSVFYIHESKLWGLYQGLSGDFRLLDVPVVCGKTNVKLISKQKLKVELTTLLGIPDCPPQTRRKDDSPGGWSDETK